MTLLLSFSGTSGISVRARTFANLFLRKKIRVSMSGLQQNLPSVPKKEKEKALGPLSQKERKEILDRYIELLDKNETARLEQEESWEKIKKMETTYPFLGFLRGQYKTIFSADLERKKTGSSSEIIYSPPAKKRKTGEEEMAVDPSSQK